MVTDTREALKFQVMYFNMIKELFIARRSQSRFLCKKGDILELFISIQIFRIEKS